MKKKAKLKKKIKINKLTKVVFIIIFLIIAISFFLHYINKKLTIPVTLYAKNETTRVATLIINKAITDEIINILEFEKLFSIIQNSNGEIETIDFNTAIVNKVLRNTTNKVQENLQAVENGNLKKLDINVESVFDIDEKKLKKGIIFEVPFGIVFNNSFLTNLGPKIPIRLNLWGEVSSNIRTKVIDYGINNALIEVFVEMKVTEQVILPFASNSVEIVTNIPVASKLVQGQVPKYYMEAGLNKQTPTLSIPVD